MLRRSIFALAGVLLAGPVAAQQPLKIALIYSKTGPLEAYARQTEAGFMLGLEYATQGKMEIDGRKIQVILKDDQLKPDMGKAALEQAYGDDKVDIAVGTTGSPIALAMLPVAEEYKKILIVEPAVADQITGEKWNRYIFRTGRNSLAGRARRRGDAEGREHQHRHARPGQCLRQGRHRLAQGSARGRRLEGQGRARGIHAGADRPTSPPRASACSTR